MRCTGCDRALTDSTKPFCPGCGTQAHWPPPVADEADRTDKADEADKVDKAAGEKSPGKKSRSLRNAATILVALGLFGSGAVAGWFASSGRDLVEAEELAQQFSASPESSLTTTMPDLRGLDSVEARQALADLGVRTASMTLVDVPAAGPEGVVLAQDPIGGEVVDGDVELRISQEARVPQIQGRSSAEVLEELSRLGTSTTTENRYVPGMPIGTIASITPKPGAPLPVEVSVVVASAPEVLPLSELDTTEGRVSSSDSSINGESFDSVLTTSNSSLLRWEVGRKASVLAGHLGIPDDETTSASARVVVKGDGKEIGSWNVSHGADPVPVSVDISGVLVLVIEVTTTQDDSFDVAFADLVLEGDEQAITTLGGDE